jgi:adenosylcobyric acid synthase
VTARALMVLGTGSHVGKSIITAGLGRILSDEGVQVAPFKAQNMSLNSAATPNGEEIGRAQALQAEACRVPPRVEMNPILIKPRTDTSSQVMLLGRVWGQVTAADYHTYKVEQLFPAVLESYQKLASQFEVMLLEGAGSPAEINLRDHDIVNMRMAKAANAACLLVGDIDRGGVFASIVGTWELLEPDERQLFKGFLINKFRGDQSLLQPGIEMIQRRIGLPCVGVVSYLHDLGLEEEDSVSLENRLTVQRIWRGISEDRSPHRRLRIGVIALPHMSNFTDFDALAAEPSVALAFIERAKDIDLADVLILPGTKQTIDDLDWLSGNGFVSAIHRHSAQNRPLIGLCGGFQMLGLRLSDPSGVENDGLAAEREGLGLLSVSTVLGVSKTTRPVTAEICNTDLWKSKRFQGYEIHMGDTYRSSGTPPFARLVTADGTQFLDGATSPSAQVFGTYVHGIFDNDLFRHDFVDWGRASLKLAPAEIKVFATSEREARLNRWADHLRKSMKLDLIRDWLCSKTVAHTARAEESI